MSKIDVSFDETTVNQWDGGSEFPWKPHSQTMEQRNRFMTLHINMILNFGILYQRATLRITKDSSMIKALDENGYPKKIELEPNQTEVVTYKFTSREQTSAAMTLR